MSEDQELEEFYEDFGSQPLSDSELETILERASVAEDVHLRRLVKEVQTMRWLLPVLLERIQEGSTPVGDTNDEVLKIARFLALGKKFIDGA